MFRKWSKNGKTKKCCKYSKNQFSTRNFFGLFFVEKINDVIFSTKHVAWVQSANQSAIEKLLLFSLEFLGRGCYLGHSSITNFLKLFRQYLENMSYFLICNIFFFALGVESLEVFSLTSLGKHLRHLSLARNKLEKIPLAFLYLKNLIYLNLNENLLTNLDGLNDFNNLQKVRVVLF